MDCLIEVVFHLLEDLVPDAWWENEKIFNQRKSFWLCYWSWFSMVPAVPLARPSGLYLALFGYNFEKYNGVFPKCFTEFSDKNICHYSKRAKPASPATSCVRDQDATTAPARHMLETGSLNWAKFILQWFISFPEFIEFAEFNESSLHLGKTPMYSSVSRKYHLQS